MKRPAKGEYAPMHEPYLKLLPPRTSAQTLLKRTFADTQRLLRALPESAGDYRYAPDKWTLKQVLIHLIDFERVMAFRILSFMRGDRIALPGFNPVFWMEEVDASSRTLKDLLQEWKAVRDNTLFLLRQCTEAQARFPGIASGLRSTPRALFYIIAGHHLHHLNTLRTHYLPHPESPKPPEGSPTADAEQP
ncbi:MAG: DinB family protein [Saprospiraceae bacterium]|nr:DinB family protein [Saprospiraceae bacterium]MDW8228689.1 DinB family protein [Saprospiraceae bacterium]